MSIFECCSLLRRWPCTDRVSQPFQIRKSLPGAIAEYGGNKSDYLLRSFDLAGSLDRTALGSAGCSRYQPFCQRRVSRLGAKLFQRDLPRLGRRLLSLDEIRLVKTSHRFSTLYFNLARAAVARRI